MSHLSCPRWHMQSSSLRVSLTAFLSFDLSGSRPPHPMPISCWVPILAPSLTSCATLCLSVPRFALLCNGDQPATMMMLMKQNFSSGSWQLIPSFHSLCSHPAQTPSPCTWNFPAVSGGDFAPSPKPAEERLGSHSALPQTPSVAPHCL